MIFQGKLPELLKDKVEENVPNRPGQINKEDKTKDNISESKVQSVAKDQIQGKKEETSYDLGQSEMDQSEEENKGLSKEQQARIERDLQQTIYISISETPTEILFYCPSTKILKIKNGK